jgi:protein-S-isoprenylcysteine O-methyltransferase Ste14
MALREEFEQTGNWLFRWRSYLPLVLVALLLVNLAQLKYTRAQRDLFDGWLVLCSVVSAMGLVIRGVVVGHTPRRTSGRSTAHQVAHQLNTSGMYSVVRHPLYLGNFLIWLGIAMTGLSWWLVVTYGLLFWVYYERIMFAEEEFLRRQFGQAFVDWSARTPAFVPNLRNWRRPELPFSLRNVLRREYTALFGIVFAFGFVELAGQVLVERRLDPDPRWVGLSVALLLAMLLLRLLKKHTRLLKVEGR